MNGETEKANEQRTEGDEIISKKELAARLRVTERTIERWQRAGHLPYFKVASVVLFNWPEVLAQLKAKYRVAATHGVRLSSQTDGSSPTTLTRPADTRSASDGFNPDNPHLSFGHPLPLPRARDQLRGRGTSDAGGQS